VAAKKLAFSFLQKRGKKEGKNTSAQGTYSPILRSSGKKGYQVTELFSPQEEQKRGKRAPPRLLKGRRRQVFRSKREEGRGVGLRRCFSRSMCSIWGKKRKGAEGAGKGEKKKNPLLKPMLNERGKKGTREAVRGKILKKGKRNGGISVHSVLVRKRLALSLLRGGRKEEKLGPKRLQVVCYCRVSRKRGRLKEKKKRRKGKKKADSLVSSKENRQSKVL